MTLRYVLVDDADDGTTDLDLELGPTYVPAAALVSGSSSRGGFGLLNFPEDAYILTYANHELYDDTTAATLTLTGSLPSVNFRCRVTISAATGHTDVAGSVVVGSETLDFLAAGTKTTTTALSALPIITTSGLDCNILVEAITTGGAPIQAETATATKIHFENTASGYFNAQGQWTVFSGSYAMCRDAAVVGDKLRYGGADLPIKKVDALKMFRRILYYIFYL